ncbi:MAG: hypothetical protein COX51_01930 [Syntrophobacteraceae bacterium CG23_combo_of_CG06-09_8_20_14_all_50_8]|nr:MAG: hypothetical protein COX51_01930 [Syntrophobacteraceae bacterium CG23_combo_of_CG06-09_8_20_14_all_50_8]
MQVFIPFPRLSSVRFLDNKRLGNQIYREAYLLIKGWWPNHPVSKMWKGHKRQLAVYCLFGLKELKARGFNYPKWLKFYWDIFNSTKPCKYPFWYGDERVHSSHRAALLFKNYEWYSQFGWKEEPKINYYWPVGGNQ